MKRRLVIRALTIAAAASSFALSSADQSLSQRTVEMVSSPNVALDLRLTPAQIGSRDKLFASFTASRSAIMKDIETAPTGKVDALYAQISKLKADLDDKLLALLSQAQQHRILEIGVQEEGSEALLDDAVARIVGLSATQRSKIAGIRTRVTKAQEAYQEAVGAAIAKIPEPGPDDAALRAYAEKEKRAMDSVRPQHTQFLAVKTAANKEIYGLLNQQQRKKWDSLHGKPLAGKIAG